MSLLGAIKIEIVDGVVITTYANRIEQRPMDEKDLAADAIAAIPAVLEAMRGGKGVEQLKVDVASAIDSSVIANPNTKEVLAANLAVK